LSKESHSLDENAKFSAKQLLSGMMRLKPILGRWAFDALVEDLKLSGIDLESKHSSYTLGELQIALEQRLGHASILLIDEIKIFLSKKQR
jgi:hypothetical protein